MSDGGVAIAEDGAELDEKQGLAVIFDNADKDEGVARTNEVRDEGEPSYDLVDEEEWYPERMHEDINCSLIPHCIDYNANRLHRPWDSSIPNYSQHTKGRGQPARKTVSVKCEVFITVS